MHMLPFNYWLRVNYSLYILEYCLSHVEQDSHKYVGCVRLSVLYVNTNFPKHYLLAWLCNL